MAGSQFGLSTWQTGQRKSTARNRLKTEPKILIIGAGAAGIACATKLLDFGFRHVQIIEAGNRIGGRILTIPFAENVVDMGAQWCHGEFDNVVFETVHGLDLLETTGDIYVNFDCVRSNGEIVDTATVDRLKSVLAEIFSKRHMDLASHEGSFGEYLATKFFDILKRPEFSDIDPKVANEFFENFKKIESSETGTPIDEVSAVGFEEYWECDGDYMLNWRDKGYEQFLKVLIKSKELHSELGVLESKIVFGTTAENIIWNADENFVKVKCKDRSEAFVADHVIITVSLGVLKENLESMFVPELPVQKRQAIEGLGFGCIAKIFIEFPHAFWPDHWTGFSTLWREEDLIEISGTPREWVQHIFGFYCVNYQPNVLLGWVVGPSVPYVESLTEEEIQSGCMYLLKRFLTIWDIPTPLNIKYSTWTIDAKFRGAYSFRVMKSEQLGTTSHDLAQPITRLSYAPEFEDDSSEPGRPLALKPVLMFAGEATSSHYYSTVHGAVESGIREASRLAGYYLRDF